MKAIVFAILTLVLIGSAQAQQPRNLAADLMTGVVNVHKSDKTGEFVADVLHDAGVGVIYRFLIFDGTAQKWRYDFAFAGHVVYGYDGDAAKSRFAILGGVSFLDGWLRLEAGYDVISNSPTYLFSTSYGITFPGTL